MRTSIRTSFARTIGSPFASSCRTARATIAAAAPGWNWVIGNYNLVAALEEKDYDYKYVFGEGAHNGNHGGAFFPDTMRWLWRDYPK